MQNQYYATWALFLHFTCWFSLKFFFILYWIQLPSRFLGIYLWDFSFWKSSKINAISSLLKCFFIWRIRKIVRLLFLEGRHFLVDAFFCTIILINFLFFITLCFTFLRKLWAFFCTIVHIIFYKWRFLLLFYQRLFQIY